MLSGSRRGVQETWVDTWVLSTTMFTLGAAFGLHFNARYEPYCKFISNA